MRENKNAAPVVGHRNGDGMTAAGGCNIIPTSVLYHRRREESRIIPMTDCSIYILAKQCVTTEEAVKSYGFHLNRAHYICCPFHNERTPSLKIYPDGWHCFGCGRGGSVIDFTAELYNLSPLEAVRRLDQDFNLHLPLDRPPSREEREQAQRRREIVDVRQQFEDWRTRMLLMLNTSYRVGHLALKDKSPDTWADAEVQAVRWHEAIEAWADALDYGNLSEQMEIFRDRKGVERICNQILNSSPEKSAMA